MKNIFIFDKFFVINSSYDNAADIKLLENASEKIVFENNEYYVSSNENLKFSLSDYNVYLSTSWCIAELDVLPVVRGFEYRALMDGYKASNLREKKFFNSCIKEKNRENTIVQNVYLIDGSWIDKIKSLNVNFVNNFVLVFPNLFKLEKAWCFISCTNFNEEKKYTVYTGYDNTVASVTYVNNIDSLKNVIQCSKNCLRQAMKKDIDNMNFYSAVDLSNEIKDINIKCFNNKGDIGIINEVIAKNIILNPKIIINKSKMSNFHKSESNKILVFTVFVLFLIVGYLLFKNYELRNKSLCIDDQIEYLISNNKYYSDSIKDKFKNIKDEVVNEKNDPNDHKVKKFNTNEQVDKKGFFDDWMLDKDFCNFDDDFTNTDGMIKTLNRIKHLCNNPNDCFSKIEFIIPKELKILSYEYNSSIIDDKKKGSLVLIVKDNENAVKEFIDNLSNYCKNLKIENVNKNSNGTVTIKMSNN